MNKDELRLVLVAGPLKRVSLPFLVLSLEAALCRGSGMIWTSFYTNVSGQGRQDHVQPCRENFLTVCILDSAIESFLCSSELYVCVLDIVYARCPAGGVSGPLSSSGSIGRYSFLLDMLYSVWMHR